MTEARLAQLHELLPVAEDDDAALSLLLLATAALDEEAYRDAAATPFREAARASLPGVVDTFDAREGYWRDELERWLDQADICVPSVAFALAALNPLIPPGAMGLPVVQNRIDGLLDMLGCPITSAAFQSSFEDISEALADAARSPAVARSIYGGQMAAAATAGWFGFVGGHVNKAILSMGDYLTRSLTGGNTFAQETAVLTTACLAFWDCGQQSEVQRIRRALVEDLSRRSSEITRLEGQGAVATQRDVALSAQSSERLKQAVAERRVLRKSLEILAPDDESEVLRAATVPDVVGTGLEDAQNVLADHGLGCTETDATAPGGAERSIWSAKNWVVVRQEPPGGQKRPASDVIELFVKKRGE